MTARMTKNKDNKDGVTNDGEDNEDDDPRAQNNYLSQQNVNVITNIEKFRPQLQQQLQT